MKNTIQTKAGALKAAILLAVLICMPFAAQAGNLLPTGPPDQGTMHSLEDIYLKLNAMENKFDALMLKTGTRFIDNKNGTVTDTQTSLIWLISANYQYNYAVAQSFCNNLASGQAGLTDGSTAGQWRLPTNEELTRLGYNSYTTQYEVPGAPFAGVKTGTNDYYWSSTVATSNPNIHLSVKIGTVGNAYMFDDSTYNYVLPVRNGN